MNHHPPLLARAFYISLALCISLILSSFSGHLPEITASAPYSVGPMHPIHGNGSGVIFKPIVIYSSGGGVTILRRSDEKQMIFEHYAADSLGLDWLISLPMEKKDSWDAAIEYRGGKLYATGLEIYSDNDSIGLRCITIDLATHRILTDTWVFRDENDHQHGFHIPKRSPYRTSFSPDISHIVCYTFDGVDEDVSKPGHAIVVHTRVYDISGSLLDSATIRYHLPAYYENPGLIRFSAGYTSFGLLDMKIDNEGSMYAAVLPSIDTLLVIKYPFHAINSPQILAATFPDNEFGAKYQLSKELMEVDPHSGVINMAASHRLFPQGAWMNDLLFATFDFGKKEVRNFAYKLNKDSLDKLLDQKNFENFNISKIIRDGLSGKTILVAEKRVVGMDVKAAVGNSSSRTSASSANYCKGFALFGFTSDGKEAFQYAFPSRPDKITDYSFSDPVNSKLGIYYSDHKVEPEGLQYRELDLSSGAMVPARNVLKYEDDTFILSGYTILEKPQSLIMIAATGDATEIKYRHGMIFRLTTP